MKILTLSERQIKNSNIYGSIQDKHIVISITSAADEECVIPVNRNRVSQLFLKFDDVPDIDARFVYFDRSMAKEIIDFVEKYCGQISLIVVQCQAGVSRSVAIGAALSKILNYTDDDVYTKGVPNMFVYTTVLDTFFGNKYWRKECSKMTQHRIRSASQYLTPAQVRLEGIRETKRMNDD